VRLAVCVVLTAEIAAVKVAPLAPAATGTEAGKVTALLLLASVTVVALGVGAVSATVQESLPAPVKAELAQVMELRAGGAEVVASV